MGTLSSGPHLIGHRGMGRSFAPKFPLTHSYVENTRASFRAAHALGATWVELDVIASREGELFLWHDQFVAGVPVHTLSSVRLRELGAEPFAGLTEDIPAGMGVNVELKPLPREKLARHGEEAILEQALELASHRPVLWSSFDPVVSRRGQDAGLPTAWLTREHYPLHEAAMAAINMNSTTIMAHGMTTIEEGQPEHLTLGFALAKEAGIPVWCWDVTPARVGELVSMGVEGFCTDAVQAVGEALASL